MKKIKEFLSMGTMLLLPVVYASPGDPVNLGATGQFSTLEDVTVAQIVALVIRLILIVAAIVSLVFLIIGGVKWITSGGDKGQVESARGTVTAALIGLLIVFATWAVFQLMAYFFDIDILSLDIPTLATLGS